MSLVEMSLHASPPDDPNTRKGESQTIQRRGAAARGKFNMAEARQRQDYRYCGTRMRRWSDKIAQ